MTSRGALPRLMNEIRRAFASGSAEDMKSRVARGAAGSFMLKVIAAGLSFITGVLLARLLGAEGVGIYAYATAWVTLLSGPSLMGLDKLVVREVAVFEKQRQWGSLKRMLSWSNMLVLGTSILIVCAAAAVGWFISAEEPIRLHAFWVALLLLPLGSVTRLRQSALRGLHKVTTGQAPEMLVQPAIVILCLVTFVYLGRTNMTAVHALWINIAATTTAFFFGTVVLYRSLPNEAKTAQPDPTNPAWIRSAVPLMLLTVLQILNTKLDILMLGSMVGTKETGIYSVANRGAGLITYVLVAVNAALGPAIASLNVSHDRQRLQRMITKSSRIVLLISLPACVGLIVFGGFFLRIFGQEFVSGRAALSILCLGQLFSAAMGSVNLLLIMTGHERDAVITLGGSTILNAALNLLLIPRWGIEGAAIASTASIVMRNAVAGFFAYRRLQIHSTALGPIGKSRSSCPPEAR